MSSIIKVDTIQNQSGANIISESANTITVGASGDTITVPSGATLGGAGTVDLSSATVTLNDTMKATPIVSVRQGGNQNLSDATLTLVAMSTIDVDTDSAFDNTAGNYKFTVPSGKAGTYSITYMATTFNEGSDIAHMQAHIYVNGGTVSYQRQRHDGGTNPARHEGCTAHWVGDLSVGDYVQFYLYCDVNSNVPVLQGSQQSRGTIVRLVK